MPNLTVENLEKILEEKLSPLSEQLKEALARWKLLNTKYEKMEETLEALQEENKGLTNDSNDSKLVQKTLNDFEQL